MKSRGKCRSQRHKAAKQRGLKTIARRYVEQNAKEYYGDIVTARCNIEMHNHEEEEGVLDPLRRGDRRRKKNKPSGQHCLGQQSAADVLAQDVLVGLCAAKLGPIRTSKAGG